MNQLPSTMYSAAQTAELDRWVIEQGGAPGFDLMTRAAEAAFDTLMARWPDTRSIAVFCGAGNNGGDGFLVAQLARRAGISTRLFYLGKRGKIAGDAAQALAAFEADGGLVESWENKESPDADVVVDALLGTGLGRPVEGRFGDAVEVINAAGEAGIGVFAIDIPSGLDADRGSVWGVAVHADATATFIGCKLGLVTGAGPAHAGSLTFHDLGTRTAAYQGVAYLARRVDDSDIMDALPPRSRHAHKGQHGHVLCVGGNHGMAGAARMASEAALRVGAGLVSVATRPAHTEAMTQARPELMCHAMVDAGELALIRDQANVLAIGPGLGQDDWAQTLFEQALASALPLVVDADGLNLLAEQPRARGNWILTPHPGEAARLLNCTNAEVQADRPAAIAALAERYNAIVVLKGAGSLIKGDEDGLWVCTAGNPGMAVGGMGDLLTGVIAGLVAQGLSMERAARIGVHIHARAADKAAKDGERGLLPSDCFAPLRDLVNPRPVQ